MRALDLKGLQHLVVQLISQYLLKSNKLKAIVELNSKIFIR